MMLRVACLPGRLSTSRRSAGSKLVALKPSSTICGRCCDWRLDATGSHRQPFLLAERGPRPRKVGTEQATMEPARRKGSKIHAAVDTLGNLLALHVTAANEQDRAQVEQLAQAVQEVTGGTVELAYVDQG